MQARFCKKEYDVNSYPKDIACPRMEIVFSKPGQAIAKTLLAFTGVRTFAAAQSKYYERWPPLRYD